MDAPPLLFYLEIGKGVFIFFKRRSTLIYLDNHLH